MIGQSPNTFVIGSGNVATTLAGALRKSGVPVLGLWGRNATASRHAGFLTGVAAFSSAPPDLILEAEVIILAVSDDAISEVASMLVKTGLVSKRHVFLHCSGVVDAKVVFQGVKESVGGTGAIHPLKAINAPKSDMLELENTSFGVQGDALGLQAAKDLVQVMKGIPLELEGDALASYHAAAAMTSNYVVALIDIGVELLCDAGMDKHVATQTLSSLAIGSAKNVAEQGLPNSLTGPIRRGDVKTVSHHLKALKGDARAVYRGLGVRTLEIARKNEGVDKAQLDQIEKLLLSS